MDDLGRGGRQIWRLFLDSNNDVRAPHKSIAHAFHIVIL